MLERLKLLLKRYQSTQAHEMGEQAPNNQLSNIIEELDKAIAVVKNQYQKIYHQEKEIIEKLKSYYGQHEEKLKKAKSAFAKGSELMAEGFYKESEIINHQIKKYKKIASNVQETKRKLMARESQFTFTKDQLLSKKALGEAQLDASQLNADLAEQLMFLNESDEFSQFDELIKEADAKSQAIEQIRGEEDRLEELSETPPLATQNLQSLIEKERAEKLQASLKNQRILIEQVFGKFSPEEDKAEKSRKEELLRALKTGTETASEKEKLLSSFFHQNNHGSEEEKSDRVKNFFEQEEPSVQRDKESVIKHFFNNK